MVCTTTENHELELYKSPLTTGPLIFLYTVNEMPTNIY